MSPSLARSLKYLRSSCCASGRVPARALPEEAEEAQEKQQMRGAGWRGVAGREESARVAPRQVCVGLVTDHYELHHLTPGTWSLPRSGGSTCGGRQIPLKSRHRGSCYNVSPTILKPCVMGNPAPTHKTRIWGADAHTLQTAVGRALPEKERLRPEHEPRPAEHRGHGRLQALKRWPVLSR